MLLLLFCFVLFFFVFLCLSFFFFFFYYTYIHLVTFTTYVIQYRYEVVEHSNQRILVGITVTASHYTLDKDC